MDRLSSSQEDYLKEIYLMSLKGQEIRVTDIALKLGISKPSVNKAMNLLKTMGYISHEHYGSIELTQQGQVLGKEIAENYKIVCRFLVEILGVSQECAAEEAHGIEHAISRGTRKKMKKYMKKVKKQEK